ncbi:MAG: hypothetical protein MI757_21320 [Pirellulales bacterium]|nr:hypothetical protein [Pirellulales bacterium]
MSLVSKIFVGFIFLAALPFSYMAARALNTQVGWRTEHENLEARIAAEEAKYAVLVNGDEPTEDGVEPEPGTRQLEIQLDQVRRQRGKVWRRCIVNQVDGGRVTLTIEHPRPHAIKQEDVGRLILHAFDQNVFEVGEAVEVDEEFDDVPEDDVPADDAPADEDMPADDAVPAEGEDAAAPAGADNADASSTHDIGTVCQDEPPADAGGGDAPPAEGEEGGAEREEGEGEEEDEEVVEEEQAEDDSHLEYEINKYMGEFKLTAVAGNEISLELIEHATPEILEKIQNSTGTWILFDTMPIDDPDAYKIWDDETIAANLPEGVPEELAARGAELADTDNVPFFWVEVEFLRSHSLELNELVEQERQALTEMAKQQLVADMKQLGKNDAEIAAAVEKVDIQIEGLRPLLDPDFVYEKKVEGEEGEADAGAPRPGVPVRRPVVNAKRPVPIRVRFNKGDRAIFDLITAAKLTGRKFSFSLLPAKEPPMGAAEDAAVEGAADDAAADADAAPAGEEAEVAAGAGDAPVATVVRRVRRWHRRNYKRIFNFMTARVSALVDLIERAKDDRSRLYVHDAGGEVIGGALFKKRALANAAKAERDLYKSDYDLFLYDYQVVNHYYKKVAAQHAAVLAERERLLAEVDALSKRLAVVKAQQRRKIEARQATSGTASR